MGSSHKSSTSEDRIERIAPDDPSDPACRCTECGMDLHDASEYHPRAACLMFKACADRSMVLAALNDVIRAARCHPEQPSVSMEGQPMGDPHPCDLSRAGCDPITGKTSRRIEHDAE